MERRIDRCLALCRDWAEDRVASGNEPPWAWYQYMELIETVTAVRAPSPGSHPNRDAVTDIDERRRQRDDDDDEDPSLPM
jgi:hypothetical protein